MPAEKRIRGEEGVDFQKSFAPQDLAFNCKAAALVMLRFRPIEL
jgi:hypothetical protein